MKKNSETIWDVAVVGGGPAGMMAAGRAAELGAKVVLIEKNAKLGKKLLITGGGRCNVTNAEFDIRKFLAKFGKDNKFLFSPFSEWGPEETIKFFNSRKMETKVEAEKRVFPKSDRAESVWRVLSEYLKETGVTVVSDSPVTGFVNAGNKIEAIRLKDGREIRARSFILATGGKSRPETGSTGDGFAWLKKLGHAVMESESALVPVSIKDEWVKKLSGLTLPDIKLTTFQNGVKQDSKKGKFLFTHFGASGPPVLNMSRDIGELLKYGEVVLSLDLLPAFDYGQLNEKLQELFKKESNKKFKNSLGTLVASALAPAVIELSGIKPDTFCHSVTREERLALVKRLKDLPMRVEKLLGTDKAVVTSGGVALTEVDFKTMRSNLYPNLYLVGDILDINRPSGGYSLQICWTTGYVAGTFAAKLK